MGCCFWIWMPRLHRKIEETFELDRVTCIGTPLENTVVDLRPRPQPKRINLIRRTCHITNAYSIHTARKVVLWVLDNLNSPPLTLEQRCVDEIVTASFLNPAELRHLYLQTFLEFYVMYKYLYDRESRLNEPRRITDPILTTRRFKSVYDVLLDTLWLEPCETDPYNTL